METVGRYLKAHREKAGIKLETVAYNTKIRLSILQDLENDKVEHLPQGVFLRGYVRAYSDAVGIRSDRPLELLDMRSTGETETPASPFEVEMARAAERSSSKLRFVAIVAAILALTVAGAWYFSGNAGSDTTQVSGAANTDVDLGTTRALTPLGPPSEAAPR